MRSLTRRLRLMSAHAFVYVFFCHLRQVVIRKVNEDINIPILSEKREERLIEKFVDRIIPKVEPSMLAIMPEVYVRWVAPTGYTSFLARHPGTSWE